MVLLEISTFYGAAKEADGVLLERFQNNPRLVEFISILEFPPNTALASINLGSDYKKYHPFPADFLMKVRCPGIPEVITYSAVGNELTFLTLLRPFYLSHLPQGIAWQLLKVINGAEFYLAQRYNHTPRLISWIISHF